MSGDNQDENEGSRRFECEDDGVFGDAEQGREGRWGEVEGGHALARRARFRGRALPRRGERSEPGRGSGGLDFPRGRGRVKPARRPLRSDSRAFRPRLPGAGPSCSGFGDSGGFDGSLMSLWTALGAAQSRIHGLVPVFRRQGSLPAIRVRPVPVLPLASRAPAPPPLPAWPRRPPGGGSFRR